MVGWDREQIHDGVLANLVFYYGDKEGWGLRGHNSVTSIFQKCFNRKLSEFCRQSFSQHSTLQCLRADFVHMEVSQISRVDH